MRSPRGAPLNPPDCIVEYARIAEPRLRAFLDDKLRALEALPVALRDVADALRDYLLRGGKRLRGALLLLGHEAAGGHREAVLDASIGAELLHAYLLIHDDFMDQEIIWGRASPCSLAAFARRGPTSSSERRRRWPRGPSSR
ncbi:MAG: hypothetical protein E6J58_01340 [Deltaproteobacteria bacterium]|nr:MAG: hypothetical protein E6J58_01340 [Deltaproteobacteria bacterium]